MKDLTVQLNKVLPEQGKKNNTVRKSFEISVGIDKKVNIPAQSHARLACYLAKHSDQYKSCTGLVLPIDQLESKCNIAHTWSLSTVDDDSQDLCQRLICSIIYDE